MQNQSPKKHDFLTTALQTVYLTVFFYFRNNLTIYASACAFGFLFSFIPTVMMIFTVLIRFLHASPEVVSHILEFGVKYKDIFNIDRLVSTVSSITGSGIFEVLIGVSIFFMARRCFASIMDSMARIFHRVSPRRPVISQCLILGGEVLLVAFLSIFIVIIVSTKTIVTFPLFNFIETAFPTLFGNISQQMINNLPYVLSIFLISIVYRIGSGTKPHIPICLFSAFCCTLTFWITVKILNIFLNMNKYNLVYGVLSHLIVVLLEVFIFFIYILLFAELVYVYQYLDLLLLGELYLLPAKTQVGFFTTLKRQLFISPKYLMKNKRNMSVSFKIGETIFKENDDPTEIYYIAEGRIQLTRKGIITIRIQGDFLGETSCILNTTRSGQAVALCDCKLVRIPAKVFKDLIEQDPRVTVKALARTSDYFSKVYGRNSTFLL